MACEFARRTRSFEIFQLWKVACFYFVKSWHAVFFSKKKKKEEKYVFPYCLSRLNRKKYRETENKSETERRKHMLFKQFSIRANKRTFENVVSKCYTLECSSNSKEIENQEKYAKWKYPEELEINSFGRGNNYCLFISLDKQNRQDRDTALHSSRDEIRGNTTHSAYRGSRVIISIGKKLQRTYRPGYRWSAIHDLVERFASLSESNAARRVLYRGPDYAFSIACSHPVNITRRS